MYGNIDDVYYVLYPDGKFRQLGAADPDYLLGGARYVFRPAVRHAAAGGHGRPRGTPGAVLAPCTIPKTGSFWEWHG